MFSISICSNQTRRTMSYIKSRKTSPAKASKYPALAGTAALTMLTGATLGYPAPLLAQQNQATAPDSAVTLPSITAIGDNDANPFKPTTLSSPKFTQPIVDTTQTVIVVPQEVIRQQQATTLTDAMRNVAGAGTFYAGENGATSTGDTIYMRGFDTSNSIYVDGIRDTSAVTRDMFNIDSVEVVKGPSGSDFGRSAPAGSINLTTKLPTLENSFNASLSAGTADMARSTIDWNERLGDSSAFRLNLMGNKSGVSGRDVVDNQRWGVAPSLAFGLGKPTTVYIDYLHVKQNNIPDGWVPTIGLPTFRGTSKTAAWTKALANAPRVDSSNFYGTLSDHNNSTTDAFTVRVEHKFTPDTVLRNTTRWSQTKQDYLISSFMFSPDPSSTSGPSLLGNPSDPSSWTMTRSANVRDSVNKILTNQTNLTTKFNTGGIKHTISTGVELIREEQTLYNHTVVLPAVNIYSPNSNVWAISDSGRLNSNTGKTDTVAGYLFDTIDLTDRWQVNGGMRLDHYSTDYDGFSTATAAPLDLSKSGNLATWKLGTLYRVAPNGNVYFNYGVSQQPPGGSNFALTAASPTANSANGVNLAPQKARSMELGTKWEVFDKRLLVSAALFRTEIENNIQLQDDGTYAQTGRQRVQGLEFGATGQITDRWSVIGGYTYQNATTSDTNSFNAGGGSGLAYTPRHALSLWSTYRVNNDFTVGGGARYVGVMSKGKDPASVTPVSTNPYWVFDAMASYQVTRNVGLQLNVYNIFNKDYVASINKSGYRYSPGLSRSAVLTANISF